MWIPRERFPGTDPHKRTLKSIHPMAKVKLALSTLKMTDKVALMVKVKDGLTGNADFADPHPPLSTLTANISAAAAIRPGAT